MGADLSIERYMSAPALSLDTTATLPHAYMKLRAHGVSALAVQDRSGGIVGVVSRTDLIRLGRTTTSGPLMSLPARPVSEVMTAPAVTVPVGSSLHGAAKALVAARVHRVFVVDGGAPVGVVSVKDVMLAVADAGLDRPIGELMSAPVCTIESTEPVASALAELELAAISGVVVVEDGWPVGIFTQLESMLAAGRSALTPVDELMSAAVCCMSVSTPLCRAARQAAASRARRVIATERRQMKGVLTGVDFARALV